MQKHRVYEEFDDFGQTIVSIRWAVSQKHKNWHVTYKARLVARGFEEEYLGKIRKDSLTCCKQNFRVLLLIIVPNRREIHCLDIKSAFLLGNKIDREVYLKPPVEAGTSKLRKLIVPVYRLCDVPRSWYLKFEICSIKS